MSISPAEAVDFLSTYFDGEVSSIEVLVGGDWSQAFGFVLDGLHLVARFGQHEDDFLKDRTAARFKAPSLPIPQVLAIGKAPGGFFCVSERKFGTMLEELGAAAMSRALPSVLAALDAMREADFGVWAAELGAPETSWANQLLSVDDENDRIFGWHDAIAESPIGIDPYQKALAYLEASAADLPEGKHLLHNDLLHRNVLVADDAITGVFDWGCAGCGDFLYDLALFTFYQPWFPEMASIDWQAEAVRHYQQIGVDVPDFEWRLRCYEVHLGLAGMAYNGFLRDWKDLEAHALRTLSRIN